LSWKQRRSQTNLNRITKLKQSFDLIISWMNRFFKVYLSLSVSRKNSSFLFVSLWTNWTNFPKKRLVHNTSVSLSQRKILRTSFTQNTIINWTKWNETKRNEYFLFFSGRKRTDKFEVREISHRQNQSNAYIERFRCTWKSS
jgi:hypothetical protein